MLSIIVPVYNVEAYLEQCLDSILNQTYTEFEILLIDDGSPDRCGDICDEYADRNKRIRVIHAEHKGLATARNIGIKEARGDYLTFVDSDDWIEAVTLSAMMEAAFSADADIVCIGHWEEEGESKKERRYSFKEYDPKGSLSTDRGINAMIVVGTLGSRVSILGFLVFHTLII
jgi:glycosyltransferase involved in cell wall biosynthesis